MNTYSDIIWTCVIITLVLIFPACWSYYYQRKDVLHQLGVISKEVADDQYEVSCENCDTAISIELHNPTTRITYYRDSDIERLEIHLFFDNREHRGANTTVLSRPTAGRSKKIIFYRNNELCGRTLYRKRGTSRSTKVGELMSALICRVKVISANA